MVGFVLDAIGLVFDVVGLAFDIADAASKESSTDLTQVYQRLDAIEQSIESSRAENQARFSELQNELNRQGMDATVRQFQSIQNNGDEGMRAWLVIHQCRINQARRQSTCPDLDGVQRPVADSIRRARSILINIVDVRWRDIDLPTLVGAYNGSGAGRGLAEAAWNFLRTQQNNRAGVPAQSPLRSSEKVPVVTPELSQGMNSILGYYSGLIARYQLLRQLAVLEKDATENGCEWYEGLFNIFLSECRRRLIEQMDGESRRWIYGTNPNGVNAAYARYKMPIVPDGAVAVAGIGQRFLTVPNGVYTQNDDLRRIFYSSSGQGLLPATRPETPYGDRALIPNTIDQVPRLLASLEQYSGAQEFLRRRQAPFTDGTVRYVAYVVIGMSYFATVGLLMEYGTDGTLTRREVQRLNYKIQGAVPESMRIDWVTVDPREAGTNYPMWGW